jgi:hypothetical protein
MPSPIHSLLADELDISEAKSQKLLSAMLREVRKRAHQEHKGVRLPDLGKFTVEGGELTFHPTDSLKRAVNHRFEGLESEDLKSAPTSGDADDETSDGPSTIRLGYQEKGWNPIDGPAPDDADEAPASADSASPSTDESSDDEGADTEEFQPPASGSPEPADAPASEDEADTSPSASPEPDTTGTDSSASPPTEEVSSPAADASGSAEPPASDVETPSTEDGPDDASAEAPASDAPDDETEKLYPLVDEMDDDPMSEEEESSDPAETDTASASSPPTGASDEPARSGDDRYDEERDALSDIWNDDSDDEDGDSILEEEISAQHRSSETDESETSFPDASASDESESDVWDFDTTNEPAGLEDDAETDDVSETSAEAPPTEDAPPQQPSPSSEASSATFTRVLVTILVLLLLGGGAWYILGQRGLVPSPQRTMAQLSGQDAAPASSDAPTASSDEGDEGAASTSGTSGQNAPSSSEGSSETSEAASADTPQQGLNPSAGGWTVVVASRGDRGTAADLAETYRQRFDDRNVPVDLIEGTVDGTTRYRVGVGQFGSQIEAETFLDANDASLPNGAWPLELK